MGHNLTVGETYTKTIDIESNCPVNFEYDIQVIDPHPDIVVQPLRGDILALETSKIEVHYTP